MSQTRRRAFIIAAAPGEKLPSFPEPTHVFSWRGFQLSVVVGNEKFHSNSHWLSSAPYRTVTVRDDTSFLPKIPQSLKHYEQSQSYFQKEMRGFWFNEEQAVVPVLRDHICKPVAPLVEVIYFIILSIFFINYLLFLIRQGLLSFHPSLDQIGVIYQTL